MMALCCPESATWGHMTTLPAPVTLSAILSVPASWLVSLLAVRDLMNGWLRGGGGSSLQCLNVFFFLQLSPYSEQFPAQNCMSSSSWPVAAEYVCRLYHTLPVSLSCHETESRKVHSGSPHSDSNNQNMWKCCACAGSIDNKFKEQL